ncbi:MAG: phasin family protein [Bdellovibrionales bacterium]
MMNENFARLFDPQEYAKNFGMNNFDFSKLMDMSAFKDMPKWWPDLKATNMNVNGVDIEAMIDNNKKNFEAITQANQMALLGMQTIMRRQADIFRETMEAASRLMNDAMTGGTPEEKLARQADLTRTAFEAATRNMQELAAMVTSSQNDCLKVINERVAESLEGLKASAARK